MRLSWEDLENDITNHCSSFIEAVALIHDTSIDFWNSLH